MDEENCFDTFFEGTSVRRSEEVRLLSGKTLVVDAQDEYGTTLDTHQLHSSRHIEDLCIRKNTSERVLIECVPGVFANTARRLDIVEFAEIDRHFYYSENLVAFDVPHNMTQVVDSEIMSLIDKRYLVKAFRGEVTLEEAMQHLSPGFKRIIGKTCAEDATFSASVFQNYLRNFGKPPFVYPRHGHREVSEALSRLNALNNVGYYVNSNLKVECADVAEYNFMIRSDYGNIYAKEYCREVIEKPYCFRVLLAENPLFCRTFFATFDLPRTMWGIGLDDSTETCPKGRYLFYFWRRDSKIEDHELQSIGLNANCVKMDIEFRAAHDNVKILKNL
eukprot:jgi/Antlo1/1807/15